MYGSFQGYLAITGSGSTRTPGGGLALLVRSASADDSKQRLSSGSMARKFSGLADDVGFTGDALPKNERTARS